VLKQVVLPEVGITTGARPKYHGLEQVVITGAAIITCSRIPSPSVEGGRAGAGKFT